MMKQRVLSRSVFLTVISIFMWAYFIFNLWGRIDWFFALIFIIPIAMIFGFLWWRGSTQKNGVTPKYKNQLNTNYYTGDREINKNLMEFLRFFGVCALLISGLMLFIAGISVARALLKSDEEILSRYSVIINFSDFRQGKSIELVTSPGVATHVTINLAKSIQGHWKSDNLKFVIEDPITSRQLEQKNLKRSDYWGDALRAVDTSEPVSVFFDLVVPTDISIGGRISGVLSGTINYPSAVAGYSFQNKTLKLNMPINIMTVPKLEIVRKERGFLLNVSKLLLLIMTPFFLLGSIILYFTNRKLRKILR